MKKNQYKDAQDLLMPDPLETLITRYRFQFDIQSDAADAAPGSSKRLRLLATGVANLNKARLYFTCDSCGRKFSRPLRHAFTDWETCPRCNSGLHSDDVIRIAEPTPRTKRKILP